MTSHPDPSRIALLPTRFVGARLVPALVLSESGFLLSGRDGETFAVNPSGRCLLAALHAGVAPLELWQELHRRYRLPIELAQRDVQLFLASLFDLGLLLLPPSDGAEPR
jgi:hypothetical protein